MIEVAEKRTPYAEDFSRSEKTLQGHSLPWLKDLRRSAINRFMELGLPTDRHEEWRFTNVKPIAQTIFQEPGMRWPNNFNVGSFKDLTFKGLESLSLVFVNGRYAPEFSSIPTTLPDGVRIASLAALITSRPQQIEPHLGHYADFERQAFTALNTAFFSDGAFIYLSQGIVLDTPIHLLFLSGPGTEPIQMHPRILVVAEPGSQASIIEDHAGLGKGIYFSNSVTEVVLGENARIDHYKIERESPEAYHISTLQVHQERASRFTSHAVLLGGALVRNNINVTLDAEGAECSLNGLYVATGHQHLDTHTLIDHAKPHGTSRELYKGVLDEAAKAVFNGQVIVRADAQKTDSVQTNKNLLLSDNARVDTKPELKIFANDVKCKHGATIGQIDPEAIFYLRSRGIDAQKARQLLIHAFASDMINRLEVAPLKEGLSALLSNKLKNGSR